MKSVSLCGPTGTALHVLCFRDSTRVRSQQPQAGARLDKPAAQDGFHTTSAHREACRECRIAQFLVWTDFADIGFERCFTLGLPLKATGS